ncbi:axonemal dynein light intermediate polypeptide 1 [Cololabis saira]|uniref:axonemal dynein light intermediate polypeptide 1 n=1 Tax=Cololabis saira TaxID=129043 RepID=UPI002AD3F4CD|nr:axonemal dynein light intermediate polypeptide 1 [Cololabis saira]
MSKATDSLLRYENAVLVRTGTEGKPTKGRPVRVSSEQHGDLMPSPPPLREKSSSHDAATANQELLDFIFPPRQWKRGNELWMQKVSSAPCTRAEVKSLGELLELKLQEKQGKGMGICPIRRELYSQCFDELIRQVTVTCGERGLLLLQVRDEIQMTIGTYQTLYESGIAFGLRQALLAEQGKEDMIKRISDLEDEKQDLIKQLNEQKALCDAIEKREAEKRRMVEKKYNHDYESLNKSHQQLKAQLEGVITPA